MSPAMDARIDITDHSAFQRPGDSGRTILIFNVNPLAVSHANEFRSDAIYETLVDTDGDAVPDIAFRYFEEGAFLDELMNRHACREREIAERGAADPVNEQLVLVRRRDLDLLALERLLQLRPLGGRTRTVPPTRAVSCSSEDSATSLPRLMINTWSTV